METTVKILATGKSSKNFGKCDICKKFADEMFHLYNYVMVPKISIWGHLQCLNNYAKKKGFETRRVE